MTPCNTVHFKKPHTCIAALACRLSITFRPLCTLKSLQLEYTLHVCSNYKFSRNCWNIGLLKQPALGEDRTKMKNVVILHLKLPNTRKFNFIVEFSSARPRPMDVVGSYRPQKNFPQVGMAGPIDRLWNYCLRQGRQRIVRQNSCLPGRKISPPGKI